MSIAITDDHRALAETAADFLTKRAARDDARALLESRTKRSPRGGASSPTSAGSACTCPRTTAARVTPSRSSWSWSSSSARLSRPARSCPPSSPARCSPRSAASVPTLCFPASPTARRSAPSPWPATSRSRRHRLGQRRQRARRRPRPGAARRDRRRRRRGRGGRRRHRRRAPQPRPDPPHRPGHPRRRSGDRPAGSPPHARRPGTRDPLRRGRRHGPRDDQDGRRVRQGADPVRPPDRHVPGRQAPLRQHGRRDRARHQRRVGRRPSRVDRRRPAHLRRRRRRHPRRARCTPVRQPQHPGARRHRHHLGARRPPVHAALVGAARHPRRGRRRDRADRPGAPWRDPREGDRAAAGGRGDPRRGAGLRRAHQGPEPRGAAHRADRHRLRHAALAQAVRP